MSLHFGGLEQWCLRTSLTNIKSRGQQRGGGRACTVQVRDKSFLSARLLCCLHNSPRQWHAQHAKQKTRFYETPHHRAEDRKTVTKHEERPLAYLLDCHIKKKKKKKHGWQREECEKEWWRTLNVLSSSITQRRGVATAFKVMDGDKKLCSTREAKLVWAVGIYLNRVNQIPSGASGACLPYHHPLSNSDAAENISIALFYMSVNLHRLCSHRSVTNLIELSDREKMLCF